MQIIEKQYKFVNGLKIRNSTNRIIVHHSASSDVSAEIIHQWHLNNGWSGIGYHFIIRQNGTIERGRPENMVGSHAGVNGNGDSIGVCIVGNFMNTQPIEAQMKSLVELIKYLKGTYGELKIIGHKDVLATACPGNMFPWDRLNKELQNNNINIKSNPIVFVNNVEIEGILHENSSYCPTRAFGDALTLPVIYDHITKKTTIGGVLVETIILNGISYSKIKPLAQSLGYYVDWDNNTKTAMVYK